MCFWGFEMCLFSGSCSDLESNECFVLYGMFGTDVLVDLVGFQILDQMDLVEMCQFTFLI